MDETAVFGHRVRERRQALGLSVRELARRLAVPPSSISQWEQGLYWPQAKTLIALAKVLECSLDWLCGLTGQPEVPNRTTKERP